MPTDLKLVIFDCDGVLVDSEKVFNQTLVEDLEGHGLSLSLKQCMTLFVGGTVANTKPLAEKLGAKLPDTWVEDFYLKVYARLRNSTEAVAGIQESLDEIEASGIPYCVASNGRVEKMEITLGQTGMLDRFKDVMFSAQTLGTAKPAPELFFTAAAAFNVRPAHCVVVEDSLNGILAAKHAGMRCLGYVPKDASHGDVLAAEGAILFDDMAKLPMLLGIS